MADEEIRTDDAADAEQANWTIKAVPMRTRILARTCATRAHKSTAAWLTWAVEVAAALQGQGAILPPADGVANPPANRTADSASGEGRHVIPPGLVELAKLAVDVTPAGKDSKAMQTIRSFARARAVALLLETGNMPQPDRANQGQRVKTVKANTALLETGNVPQPDRADQGQRVVTERANKS